MGGNSGVHLDREALADSLAAEVTIARAAELARHGLYHSARELLDGLPDEKQRSPAVLDLQGRIAAQQGRLSEARDCWGEVVERNPGEASALAALRRIDAIEGKRFRPRASWLVLLGLVVAAMLLIAQIAYNRSVSRDRELIADAVQRTFEASQQASEQLRAVVGSQTDTTGTRAVPQ